MPTGTLCGAYTFRLTRTDRCTHTTNWRPVRLCILATRAPPSTRRARAARDTLDTHGAAAGVAATARHVRSRTATARHLPVSVVSIVDRPEMRTRTAPAARRRRRVKRRRRRGHCHARGRAAKRLRRRWLLVLVLVRRRRSWTAWARDDCQWCDRKAYGRAEVLVLPVTPVVGHEWKWHCRRWQFTTRSS